jgi:hypothetical protein
LVVEGSRTWAKEAPPAGVVAGSAWSHALFAVWAERPLPVLAPWAVGSLLIGLALLGASLLVAVIAGPTVAYVPVFADSTPAAADALHIALRNGVVLALEALVCIAVYLCTRPGERHGGWALSIVVALTAYSLLSQVWRLGHDLASAAHTLGLAPADLLARLSLHAVPELTALYLPLAACLSLVRRGRTDDLAAAAALTTIVAIPLVVICAFVEVFLTRYMLPA